MSQQSPPENRVSFLRLEGVNLSAFVFDTRDLSTVRGGSLMLLNAVDAAAVELGLRKGHPGILSRGASSGLLRIEGDSAKAAEKVRAHLASVFPHATFVVDVVDVVDSASFADAREQLLAANRWRQMQASTLAVPEKNSAQGAKKPACALDGRRPADPSSPAPNREDDKSAFISQSTKTRREYGRAAKQTFYEAISGSTGLPGFAHDFESIAVGSKPLDGKLAVFYADGNGFGGIQTRFCRTPYEQRDWDELIRGTRAKFLREFLVDEVGVGGGKALRAESPWHGFQRNNRDRGMHCIRFETLLWGGDEVLFVMPAALGWRFASLFFKGMRGMRFGKENLTHAAALVFCQHHAPIHRIMSLAKDQVTEFAKTTDRAGDSLMAVALESFDHLGTDFEAAMTKRYAGILPLKRMRFTSGRNQPLDTVLSSFAERVQVLRRSETFPRSQLRGLVGEMIGKRDSGIGRFRAETDASGHLLPPSPLRNTGDKDRGVLAGLRADFDGGGDPDGITALWLQLEELWDYALP